MPESYPFVRGDTAQDCSIELYGVFEREEQYNAI